MTAADKTRNYLFFVDELSKKPTRSISFFRLRLHDVDEVQIAIAFDQRQTRKMTMRSGQRRPRRSRRRGISEKGKRRFLPPTFRFLSPFNSDGKLCQSFRITFKYVIHSIPPTADNKQMNCAQTKSAAAHNQCTASWSHRSLSIIAHVSQAAVTVHSAAQIAIKVMSSARSAFRARNAVGGDAERFRSLPLLRNRQFSAQMKVKTALCSVHPFPWRSSSEIAQQKWARMR